MKSLSEQIEPHPLKRSRQHRPQKTYKLAQISRMPEDLIVLALQTERLLAQPRSQETPIQAGISLGDRTVLALQTQSQESTHYDSFTATAVR